MVAKIKYSEFEVPNMPINSHRLVVGEYCNWLSIYINGKRTYVIDWLDTKPTVALEQYKAISKALWDAVNKQKEFNYGY